MKALHISLSTATLLLALGGSAMAQSTPAHPATNADAPHGHTHKAREHMGARHGQHLAQLKTQLRLGSEQEAAWNAFAQAMTPPAHGAGRAEPVAMDKLSTPERIDQMLAMHAQRDAEMKQRAQATKTFYASLNAEQQKTFDAQTARFMKKGGSGRAPHGHHAF